MNFSDERYVRLYSRDTTTWKRLGWEGQCTLCQILRRLDRSGVLEIEDVSPAAAVSLHTGGPIAFIAAGVAKLLELGVMEHVGTSLVFPKFIEAQEAATSDKQRQKESRERRRSQARSVTSQNVTECHTPSHAVTASHSVPCLASRAEEDTAEAVTPAAACEVLEMRHVDPLTQERAAAMKGLGRLQQIGLMFHLDGNHKPHLVALGSKPAEEWETVKPTLHAEVMKGSKVKRMLTPRHIADFWQDYLEGRIPGQRDREVGASGPEITPDYYKPMPAFRS